MRNTKEMLEGLAMYAKYPALFLYPWVLAWVVGIKNSGSQSEQIPFDIPVVKLYDFSHPNEIREKDCPFAIDGERYYFTEQVRSGNRSQRKAGKQGAFWKSTSKDIDIKDLDEKLIGYMRKYTLYEDKDCKISSKWHMEEYMAPEKAGPYTLCKIYDKESHCPKYTETSIPALTERFTERQLRSHRDQTNSQFDSTSPSNSTLKNPLQIQFDHNNFGEDLFMQQTLPTFESSTLDSFPPIPLPPDYSNGVLTSHDASGSQNPPVSTAQFPFLNDNHFLHELDNLMDYAYILGNLNTPAGEESPHFSYNDCNSHY